MSEATSDSSASLPVVPGRSPRSRKRAAGFLLVAPLLSVLCFIGLRYLETALTHESTDDAFIDTGIVAVSPKVSGVVAAVHVQDNQAVQAGDPLVDLDPRDYETTLVQKQAALAVSESNKKSTKAAYELMAAKLATAQAVANQSVSEAAASQATADKAEADLKRAETLRVQRVLSQQEFDQIRTTAIAARANAAADQDQAQSDRSKVAEAKAQLDAVVAALEMAESQINQAQAEVASANLDLSYTHLVAPTNGIITKKSVHAGEYLQPGQRLLALVPTHFWVTANFKETQLDHIRPGMPASIRIDAYPELQLAGHVESIQSGSGARFSLLPPENAVGNFVKVVQRVPVKIVFDTPLEGTPTVGPGMSVVPSVRTSNYRVADAILGLIALGLALGGSWLGLKALPNGSAEAATS